MEWDPKTGELQNFTIIDGNLRVRPGLQQLKTPTAGTTYVAGFTVESPSSTEPFHYLFEQSATTAVITLRVYTEEFAQVFSLDLGPMQARPVVSYAVANNQLMINSPSFTGPLYGLVGGGLLQAQKTTSIQPNTTTLDIPPGIICSFGGRMPIANGQNIYFNDPTVDPKSYVAENRVAVPGTILDMFQGTDGALHIFTTQECYTIPPDALGQGQTVAQFVSTVVGLNPMRMGNANISNGVIGVLSKDGLISLGTTTSTTVAGAVTTASQTKLPIKTNITRHNLGLPVELNDCRAGRLFKTANGFLISFLNRKFALNVDIRNGFSSYIWNTGGQTIDPVGTLRGRDGDDIYVLSNRVVVPYGNADWDGSVVRGVTSGHISVGTAEQMVVRSVTVKTDNLGQNVSAYVGKTLMTSSAPTLSTKDVVIGTSVWANTGTLNGREMRTTRMQCDERLTDVKIEVAVEGALRQLAGVDVEVQGQGKERRDRW